MNGQTGVKDVNEFDAALQKTLELGMPRIKVEYGLFALTRLGERPVEVERFAAFLEQPEDEAVALATEQVRVRTEGGLIHIDPSVPDDLARRWLVVGDRRIGMSGCAPDLFGIAAVLDVPFRVEDTCAATGAPIRVDFIPGGVETTDPPQTAVAMIALDLIEDAYGMEHEQVDAEVCSQMPFFVSVQTARGWLADHPQGAVLTVTEMIQLKSFKYFRDSLRPLLDAHSP